MIPKISPPEVIQKSGKSQWKRRARMNKGDINEGEEGKRMRMKRSVRKEG